MLRLTTHELRQLVELVGQPPIDGIPKCWRRHSTVIPLITEGKTEYKAIEFDLHNGLRGNHARYMSGAVRAKGEIEFVRVKLAP